MANHTTPTGVLNFPQLFEAAPRSKGSEKLVYSATLTFDEAARNTQAYRDLEAAVEEIVQELMKKHKIKREKIDVALRDGDEKADKYPSYAGTTYIAPWSQTRPGVIGPDKETIFDKEDVYSGQLARFNIRPFGWEYSGKYGVNFNLNGVQIQKLDCPRLDGKASVESMFDDAKVSSKATPF
jgi:hypothetical protein